SSCEALKPDPSGGVVDALSTVRWCMREVYRMRLLGCGVLLRRGQSKSFALTRRLDPFQQKLQARPIHLSRAHRAPVADEAARLQALRPQTEAAAIEIQHADLRAAAVDEHIQPAVQRILTQSLPDQRLQSIERAAQVSWLTVQIHPHLTFRKKHQPRESCNTTPPPNSSRSSMREPPARSAPRSTNSPAAAVATGRAESFADRSSAPRRNFSRQRFRLDRLIPSCWQNPSAGSPSASNRSINPRQASALRRRRLLCCIARSRGV